MSKSSMRDDCAHDDGKEPHEYLVRVLSGVAGPPGAPLEDTRLWAAVGTLAASVEGKVRLTVGFSPFWRHCLTALAATGITYYVLSLLMSENPMGYTVIALFVWIAVLTPVFWQVMHVEVDPSILRACHLCKKKLVALELPNGKWIVIRVRPNHDEFLATLRGLYGDNMRDT